MSPGPERHSDAPSPRQGQLSARLAWFLLVLSLLIILYSTLKYFDFRFRPLTPATYVAGFVLIPSSLLDFPRNILLFIPFGFALAALLTRAGFGVRRVRLLTATTGLALTLSVESLQLFLPERAPSVSDLASNTLGALAGAGLYELWLRRTAIAHRIERSLGSARLVAALLVLVTAGIVLIALLLGSATRFSEWEMDFPLLIGNERGGQRPWRGAVQDIALINRALSPAEVQALLATPQAAASEAALLAFYPLAGATDWQDWTGNEPDLYWRAAAGAEEDIQELDGQHWLQSEAPVAGLSAALQATSQVTIVLTVAAGDLGQGGPARILSISPGLRRRNLTVGQVGPNLVLRLNTPVGGDNGDGLEMHFPQFFTDMMPRRLAIVYDGLSARVYTAANARPQTFELLPGPVFYRLLNPYVARYWTVTADPFTTWLYRLLYYVLLFSPAGLLLAIARSKPWPPGQRMLIWLWGILVLPLMAEWALVVRSGAGPRPLSVLLGALGVLAGALVLGPWLNARWRVWRAAHEVG